MKSAVELMQRRQLAMCGSVCYFYDRPSEVQSLGGCNYDRWFGRVRVRHRLKRQHIGELTTRSMWITSMVQPGLSDGLRLKRSAFLMSHISFTSRSLILHQGYGQRAVELFTWEFCISQGWR